MNENVSSIDPEAAQADPKRRKRKRTIDKLDTPLFKWFLLPLTYGMIRQIILFVERLSPSQVYLFARGLALLWHSLSPRHRKTAIRNVEIAYRDRFTPKERKKIARQVVQHFFLTTFDLFILPRYLPNGDWQKIFTMTKEQEAFMQRIMKSDRPVAFHTAHLGSWETMAGLAGIFDRKLHLVYRPLDHPQVDKLLKEMRTRLGNEAHAKKGVLRAYAKALRHGEWIGVIADQNAGRRAAYLDFFGVPASTETSYFPLYQRFKPLIATGFAIRDGFNFKFHIEGFFEEEANTEADATEESMRLGQWYLDCIEKIAKRYPEQYLWTHRRYTSRPGGIPSLYQNLESPLEETVRDAQPKTPVPPYVRQE